MFRPAGYRTAAFVSGFPLDRRFGLDRGFDDVRRPPAAGQRPAPDAVRGAPRRPTTDAALRWLERRRPGGPGRPFLLWVHYYDPHAPYEPPAETWSRAFARPRTTARSPSSTAAGSPAAQRSRRRGPSREPLVAGDVRPRREPRRARRRHPRPLRLRRDAAGAVDHGRPRRPGGTRSRRRSRGRSTSLPTLLDYCGLAAASASSRAARCARRSTGREMTTRRPTPSRSTRSSSSAGRRCSPGGPRALQADRRAAAELYDLAADAGRAHDRADAEAPEWPR